MPRKNTRDAAADEPISLQEAIRFFSDEDRAHAYLLERRWPDGEVRCPTCGSGAVHYLAKYRRWKCASDHAQRQFSIKVGTIMEGSPLPLGKWLAAMWMAANCKNGVSSYEVHRALDITQKSAWFMLQRIRLAMQAAGRGGGKFDGEVEVDETFIGGKARFMHADKRAEKIKGRGPMGKVAVMGLLARHGKDGHSVVRTHVVGDRRKGTLQKHVRDHVEPGSVVHSDELLSYRGLDDEYVHHVINHAECYARGTVHTNGMENFWSLLKRGIRGTYVSVEPFHLFRYLDEQAFRFNERKDEEGDRGRFKTLLDHVAGKRLTYRALIGDAEPLTPALA